jgi:hypothetical protein
MHTVLTHTVRSSHNLSCPLEPLPARYLRCRFFNVRVRRRLGRHVILRRVLGRTHHHCGLPRGGDPEKDSQGLFFLGLRLQGTLLTQALLCHAMPLLTGES